MGNRALTGLAAGVLIATASATASPPRGFDRGGDLDAFRREHPGTMLSWTSGRIVRIWGRAFSRGNSAVASAETFRLEHAGIFGLPPDELVPADGEVGLQPIGFDPDTGGYRFTGIFYRQQRGGVPVFCSRLKLLVRNDLEAGFPLVLAAADVRDLGGLRVPDGAAGAPPDRAGAAGALARAAALSAARGAPVALSTRKVIWAGVDEPAVRPRLADETIVGVGPDAWLVLTDATTGAVLHEQHLVHDADVQGGVRGLATEGVASELCENELTRALPYLEVITPFGSTYSQADGDFVISDAGEGTIEVTAMLRGLWFNVIDFFDNEAVETVEVELPAPANLLFNAANDEQRVRAQVNGYVHANRIRDWVLGYNPAYPGLDGTGSPVIVNRTDFLCPGNAWYNSIGGSINFCLGTGGMASTAFSSLVYHEYGHHLVHTAGSGQGAYGEGMGDAMSVLILDEPMIAVGVTGNCFSRLRNAENTCQYDPVSCSSCNSEIHICGTILSGSIWETRQALGLSDPDEALEVVSDLAVGSMLMHTGSQIEPEITVDFLTLDDDDADICNGTPHHEQIAAGFAAHGLLTDCNGTGTLDACDIAAGRSADVNDNDVPDECECLGDLDGDGTVGGPDLAAVLASWGPVPARHPADLDADGLVSTIDLLAVLAGWGDCE